MRLDAAHQIRVVARRLDDRLHIDAGRAVEIDIAVAEEAAGEIGRDEGIDPGLRGLDDEFAEAVEGQGTGAALIDDGRYPRTDADQVRVEAEIAGDVLIDMRVGVDQPGGDDQARGVDRLRAPRIELRRDGGDAAFSDPDVEHGVDAVGRIDDPPAGHDDIMGRLQLRDGGAGGCRG